VQARTKEEGERTAVVKAQYELDRARLDYSALEILSRVEGEQRRLAVLDAEEKLREATAVLESGRRVARADLAVAEQKRDKARVDVDKARRQLQALQITAPADGHISLLINFRSGGFGNQQEFRAGDAAWPGAAIAELPDASSLFVAAKIDEVERGRLSTGQMASVRVEAVPDRELSGRIEGISTIAKADFSTWPPPRNFDLTVALQDADARLRPGMTAAIRVAVERLTDTMALPAEAVFQDRGEDVVYVVDGRRVERRPVAVHRRNAEQAVIGAGVRRGARRAAAAGGGEVGVARLIALVVALALGAAAVLYGLPDLTPRSTRIPTTRPQRGDVPVEVHALGDLRALRSTGLTAPVGRGHAPARPPAACRHVREAGRPGDGVRSRRAAVQPGAGPLGAARGRAGARQARGRRPRAGCRRCRRAAEGAVRAAPRGAAGRRQRVRRRHRGPEERALGGRGPRVLAQLEDDARTHAESTAAGRAVLEERRRKAQIAMQLAERHIESMTVRAPMDGLVVIKENRNATGGFFTTGMTLPDFREGDTVQPGTTVAEVVDVRELEIRAKVPETDRPSVGDGAPASVNIEAVPGSVLAGSTKGVGGLASRNFWDTAPRGSSTPPSRSTARSRRCAPG
jgi:HlyD family secretion protein